MQKIPKGTYPQRDRAEPEGYAGGQTFMGITENNFTDADQSKHGMLEFILSPDNLNRAYQQVKRNKGSAGVDKMEVESLKDYLVENKEKLIASVLDGKFRPDPVLRVEIPKDNGKKRQLGIPTVVDRVLQQAIAQILSPVYEKQFSQSSFGFRPKRSAHQALSKCKEHITEGYLYAVDMDLEKFFDTVNQSKLVEILSRTVKDGRVISLIHKYLNAGVVVNDRFEDTKIGVPQGGPLSPLLGNIMLNELDRELEKRGHRFVRYADDLVILCRSKRSAHRTLRNILPFIEEKLLLKVNREKTSVAFISKIKFLGYAFYTPKGKGRLRVHPSSVAKMKQRLKELTSRAKGWGNKRRKEKLNQFITGWVNYFRLADIKKLLQRLDMWLRKRIRAVIWKQWKIPRTRGRNLIKLGVVKENAWALANTRKKYWRVTDISVIRLAISNERLRKVGYIFLWDYYRKVNGIS